MKDYIVVNFSGGKDSTAMLLRMLELGEHIDEVMCCDTYKEFPAMYRHIDKIKEICANAGVKFVELRCEQTFDYLMFEHQAKRRNKALQGNPGYSWPGPLSRWCTSKLKIDVMDKYLAKLRSEYNVIQCIGIAADEGYRLERANNQQADKKHPLVDWGWDENACLQYCYSKGYDWEGLYKIFKRVSCWCCPLNTLDILRGLKKHRPELWEELKDMDQRSWNQYRRDYSVKDLEKRFEFEEALTRKGQSTTNRAFHADLKRLLAEEATIDDILQERESQLRIPQLEVKWSKPGKCPVTPEQFDAIYNDDTED